LAAAIGALLGGLALHGARAQALPAAPLREGDIAFAVDVDNGPDFVGRVAVADAAFTGTALSGVRGYAEARVAAMRTGIGLRDRHLRNAMDADSFPALRFELDEVRVGHVHGDTTDVALHGFLVLHGQRRAVRAEGRVVATATAVALVASFPVDMREYGITPPTRFLGSVRVRPVAQITARLRFDGSAAGQHPEGT
jgi:polyisoprenoid-binding protein YceI